MFPSILDANLNRVAEGLRVIEDYVRFVAGNKEQAQTLASIRQQVSRSEASQAQNLNIRDTQADMRAKDTPKKRTDVIDLLKANFKRVEEGLRVLEEYSGDALYNTLRYDLYELEKEIVLPLFQKPIATGVYLISDKIEILEQGLKWGVALIQLRDKVASKSDLLQKAKKIKKLSTTYTTPLIINDHLDIALAIDADGFHSGQDDIDIPTQRQLLGPHKIIGRTTHTLKQGLHAQKKGADYVSVGPIWDTPSKPNRKGIGFDYLKKASTNLTIPYVAIGGINLENANDIIPYKPPLIGIIRAYRDISGIVAMMKR